MTTSPPVYPKPLQLIIDHPDAPKRDTIEVFVCDVPLPTSDPLYGDLPLRVDLDPHTISVQLELGVWPYFTSISHGAYLPTFTAGKRLTMEADETHDQCVERALDASTPDAMAVLVVATAEDIATQPGGWGRPGSACTTDSCPASVTRRAAYVGASDFYDVPPTGTPLLDLIEHEIGHTLDLPHSGDPGDEHASGLDLMSNSAAPRDVQPDRIHGPDTIAVDRLSLGWLPVSAVAVADPTGGTFSLWPSTGEVGTRLLVLPIDDTSFLSVELLSNTGYDDFLPSSGVAVHLIDESPAACGHPATGQPCTGIDRKQYTLGSAAPHLQLLRNAERVLTLHGWTIRLGEDVVSGHDAAQVEVRPTDG